MTDCCISILRPDVVNQIAAGEVVERPASVVKEVVENALDARARRVDVATEHGGRRRIRVVDDGIGMTETEARLSLERHATSKLRCVDDLSSIRTMGFRGEALPSIASVSRFTLVTRPEHLDRGFTLVVEGGSVQSAEPSGCGVGTQVEIADLFFNTPARLKFLKSTATEAAHITDAVSRLALSSPQVHFTLTQDGRQVLNLPPCRDSLERARAVLGRQGQRLFCARHQQPGLEVEANLAPSDQTVRTARSITLTVNGRYIRDRSLVQAVVAGYGDFLENGQFPVAVVHLAMDPSTVDVNAHPQKTEVRFDQPRQVAAAIRGCITDALGRPPDDAINGRAQPRKYQATGTECGEGYEEHRQRIREATRHLWSPVPQGRRAAENLPAYSGDDSSASRAGPFSALRVVGQVMGTYLVCEAAEEMVLVDRNAAHERVTYEELRQAVERERVPAQRLLIPITLGLEPPQDAAARQQARTLAQLGFDLEDFGACTWAVRAVPLLLRHAEPGALVRDVLDELGDVAQQSAEPGVLDAILARMARHGAVRVGEELEEDEVRALLMSLDQLDPSAESPRGRPVIARLSRGELEGRFGRGR